ncbi:hypothetical protein [Nonomuraea endophytica]|uniref:hypothetical protein n=1 Tax=Nonomuraea endophytica TaxID=714136 RepID=UPI0037CB6F05
MYATAKLLGLLASAELARRLPGTAPQPGPDHRAAGDTRPTPPTTGWAERLVDPEG